MGMDGNPFKAPTARVADPGSSQGGNFVPEGRKVPAGNGWIWVVKAWELFKLSPGMWIGMFLIYMVINMVVSMIPLASIAVNLFMPVFMAGFMLGCKALEEGEELQINHLFAGFSDRIGNLVLVGLIYMIGIIVIVMAAGVMAALSIPMLAAGGKDMAALAILPILLIVLVASLFIIPLVMAIWYAPALIVFHDLSPVESMKTSLMVSIKNFVPYLVYGAVFLGLAIVATLPCFLGWLVLSPVLMVSIYTSYRDMFIEE